MQLRNSVFQAAALATLLVACGGRDNNPDGGDAGCIGVCGNDGGQDAGDGGFVCNGVSSDMGRVEVGDLRNAPVCGQKVFVPNVVVHHVNFVADGGSTRCVAGSKQAEFWVGPADGGIGGVYIDKFCDDAPALYEPVPGHRLNITGYLYYPFARSGGVKGAPHSQDRTGYRLEIGTASNADPSVTFGTNLMSMTTLNAGNPFITVNLDSSYGADAGAAIAHDEMLATRVHIPGPVYIEDPAPSFMLRYNADYTDAGAPLYVRDGGNNYMGFTVTGGIPIYDVQIRSRCDWRNHLITDGGSSRLVFEEGITGVWDSITMVPFINKCADGGSNFVDCAPTGYIPAPDGGHLADRVNAVYVTDCADYGDAGFVP